MTYRPSDSSSKDFCSRPQSRLNQQIRCESTDEGCPVIEESGTVCGETNSFTIFQEFRQIYDDCLKNLEGSDDGSGTLKRLAPFRNLIENLWNQNALLVETVEELEHEATCTVTNLQEKLNKSCQKMNEYQEDIASLVAVIRRFCESGVFDPSGLKFNTVCPTCICDDTESSCATDGDDFDNMTTDTFDCSTYDVNPTQERMSCSSFKKKATPGILCKNYSTPPANCGSDVQRMSSSRMRLSAKLSKIESEPDLIQEPMCNGYCFDSNCQGNCIDVFDQTTVMEPVPCDQDCMPGVEYQECRTPININLNIGRDAIRDQNPHDCECPCSSGCDC